MNDTRDAEIIRKISGRTVCGNLKKVLSNNSDEKGALAKDGAVMPLFQVYGQATGVRSGTSDYGPWACLTGQFEAVNINADAEENEGKLYASPQCFLPEPMNSQFIEMLKGEETDGVQFALEIGMKRVDTAAVGYEFTTKPLVKATGSDPLADLRSQVLSLTDQSAAGAGETVEAKKGAKK